MKKIVGKGDICSRLLVLMTLFILRLTIYQKMMLLIKMFNYYLVLRDHCNYITKVFLQLDIVYARSRSEKCSNHLV